VRRRAALGLGIGLGLGLGLGCGGGTSTPGRIAVVERRDLVLDVEVTGTLKSTDSEQIGPPAAVTDTWEFKIIRMTAEGTKVKPGDEVIAYDPSALEQKLKDFESEVAAVTEDLRRVTSEGALARVDDGLDLEDAEAKRRKADLKADKPPELTSELTLRLAGLDRELARREVTFRHRRDTAKRAQQRSESAVLEIRLRRAQGRAAEIRNAIKVMSVKARRAGTVVYKQDWRGEKKKVGDGMWRGESVLEIASLDRMAAQGQVDEVDASKVAVGQRVGLKLEAHPDKEYAGVVERVGTLVQTESPESRVRVVQLEIHLAETDPLLMRPQMRFRGRIETARTPDVLQIPLAAIQAGSAGPTVLKLGGSAPAPTPIEIGRRTRDSVEVLRGLAAGDRVLLRAVGDTKKDDSAFRLGAS
jgi:HlyD family secretion protein